MSRFWATSENIPQGIGFSTFGIAHLCWLVGAALLCSLACVWCARVSRKCYRTGLKIVACALCVAVVTKIVVLVATGQFLWKYAPINLCGASVVMCMFYAFQPRSARAEFLYAVTLPTALLALLDPGWTLLPQNNFWNIYLFGFYILLLLFPLMTLAGGFRPNSRRLWRVVATLLCLIPPLYLVHRFLNSGLLFLVDTSEAALLHRLAKRIGRRAGYYLYPILLMGWWTILYVPYTLARRRNERRELQS